MHTDLHELKIKVAFDHLAAPTLFEDVFQIHFPASCWADGR